MRLTNTYAWGQLRAVESDIFAPDAFGSDSELRGWSRHSHVNIEASVIGGARIVDLVVYEVPIGYALEANDAAIYWVGHGGSGAVRWPYDRKDDAGTDGDPRQGTQHLLDVHHAAWDRLKPALITWTSHSESLPNGNQGNADGTSYTEPYIFVNSTTLTRFPDNMVTTYNASEPGWSLASGAYSRNLAENHPNERNGSIPVLVRVRAGTASNGTNGVLRVQASAYSYVDVSLTNLQTTPGVHRLRSPSMRAGSGRSVGRADVLPAHRRNRGLRAHLPGRCVRCGKLVSDELTNTDSWLKLCRPSQ